MERSTRHGPGGEAGRAEVAGFSPIAERLRSLRYQAGLTVEALARAVDSSVGTISRVEHGQVQQPKYALLARLARFYGFPSVDLLLGDAPLPEPFVPHPPAAGEPPRVAGARPLPVYRWGACGDPRSEESAPYPDHLEYPPAGKELLLGARGFGVEVRGSSMTRRRINDGDVVWCNPDLPPRVGGVVLARCWDAQNQEVGMVVKLWKNAPGEQLTSDGDNGRGPVDCARYELLAPVLVVSPKPYPPG